MSSVKNQSREPRFVLNQWSYGKNGAVMNVVEIKKSWAETASQILELE